MGCDLLWLPSFQLEYVLRAVADALWSMSSELHRRDRTVTKWLITSSDEYIKRLLSSVAENIHKTKLTLFYLNYISRIQTYSKAPLLRKVIIRLSILIPAFVAILAAATPSPASDSVELIKRYCGNNPPADPACPQGLFQVSGNVFYASS